MTTWQDLKGESHEDDALERLHLGDAEPRDHDQDEDGDDGVLVDRFISARANQLDTEPVTSTTYDEIDDFFVAPTFRDRRSHTMALVEESEAPPDDYNLDDVEPSDDANWVKDMGFPDPLGALRVWVDDDDVIERVRLSLHWRTRLADSSLSDAFDFAFLLINNYKRRRQERLLDFFEPERVASEPLSWASLGKLRSRQREIRDELEALGPDGGATTIEGTETLGTGARGRVQVLLNLEGLLLGVGFDEKWLKTARIKEISDGVVEAHRDARARFVPGEITIGERERLINEMSTLRNEVLAMMRRGFY